MQVQAWVLDFCIDLYKHPCPLAPLGHHKMPGLGHASPPSHRIRSVVEATPALCELLPGLLRERDAHAVTLNLEFSIGNEQQHCLFGLLKVNERGVLSLLLPHDHISCCVGAAASVGAPPVLCIATLSVTGISRCKAQTYFHIYFTAIPSALKRSTHWRRAFVPPTAANHLQCLPKRTQAPTSCHFRSTTCRIRQLIHACHHAPTSRQPAMEASSAASAAACL